MSVSVVDPISVFHSQLRNRRLGAETLRLLESLLVSRDVGSLLRSRSILQDILRVEGGPALREAEGRGVEGKLHVADFFVKAFALVGDVESCLALKYEALILRELRTTNDASLGVSHDEWLTLATDSLHHGFYPIAIKGFDNALRCIQTDCSYMNLKTAKTIREQREMVLGLVCSLSVQAQAAKYLKEKHTEEKQGSFHLADNIASSTFRKGIRTRNLLNLQKSRAKPTLSWEKFES